MKLFLQVRGHVPEITDPLPANLAETRDTLAAAIDEVPIPAKELDRNLLVGTWNLRAFGGLTDKWRAEKEDSPKRDLFDIVCLAEVISRFDVVALPTQSKSEPASGWGMECTRQ